MVPIAAMSGTAIMLWPKTGATHYKAQLGLPYQGRAIKVDFLVCWVGPARNWAGGFSSCIRHLGAKKLVLIL